MYYSNLCCFEEMNSIPAEKQCVLQALKCLGTNAVGTKVYSVAFSGILSSGGFLHSDIDTYLYRHRWKEYKNIPLK